MTSSIEVPSLFERLLEKIKKKPVGLSPDSVAQVEYTNLE